MMGRMKITLNIDEALLAALEARADEDNLPFEQVVDLALRRGFAADEQALPRPSYKARTFAMGRPLVPDLDASLALAAGLEDEATARKLRLRK